MIMKSRIGLSNRGAAFWVKWVVLSVLCLGIICAVVFFRGATKGGKDVDEPVLLAPYTGDFDAAVVFRQTITDDYRRWAKKNKWPLRDPSIYSNARFVRQGDRFLAEVSTFDKNDKLTHFCRVMTQFHTGKTTRAKSGTTTIYQYQPEEQSHSAVIETAREKEDVFVFGLEKQALYRHIFYDGVSGKVRLDQKTKDILEVSRESHGHILKAIYSDYQTIDGRRIAKHMADQFGIPDSGKLAKTVYTELIDFKSKPDPSIFLNIIPPGVKVFDFIKDIDYIQPEPGGKIVPL